MNRLEKTIVIGFLIYVAAHVVYYIIQMYQDPAGAGVALGEVFPSVLFAMAFDLAAFIVTIRDLYLRPFPDPNSKLTWLLFILLPGGIGWVVYVFRHAIRPRTEESGESV